MVFIKLNKNVKYIQFVICCANRTHTAEMSQNHPKIIWIFPGCHDNVLVYPDDYGMIVMIFAVWET